MTEHPRDVYKRRLIQRLNDQHQGPDNGLTMTECVAVVLGEIIIPYKRNNQSRLIRDLVAELQRDGHPICHKSGKYGGYYIATNDDQLDAEAAWHHKRAIASLTRVKHLRKITTDEVVEQVKLDLEESNNG
jgi:hypothetical protein